jgi:nitrous oxidase accessory protein
MGNGIHLWRVKQAIVRGNDVARVRDGVYLTVTTDSLVEANLMRGVRFGLHYMYNDQNRIAANVVCDARVGLAMMFSRRLEIVGNVALRNEEHGILFRSILDSRIEGNRAEGNGKGFFLNDSSFNALRGNLVRDNAIGVHLTAGSEDNRVEGNNFIANPVQIRLSWRRPIAWHGERLGNYWSDYLGWDLDGDRVGDLSYHSASRMDQLVYRYPQLKLLAASPVVKLMQALESRFPVLRPAGVVDARPAMAPFALPEPAGTARAMLERCAAAEPQHEPPPAVAAPAAARGGMR